jgi:Zn-dependent membrane protease YugP
MSVHGALASPDLLYLLLLAPLGLALYANHRLEERFERFHAQPNRHVASGVEAAEVLLDRLGLRGVRVERAHGRLADHYDPLARVLRLSPEVARGRSIAAVGTVAHEVGHAHQDATGYPLLALQQRVALYVAPLARFSGWFLVAGLLFGLPVLVVLAGGGLAGAALVGALSVPVERDASRRAVAALAQTGLADEVDLAGVRTVLSAAALTYLVGLAQRVCLFLALLGLIQWFGLGL